MGHLRGDRVWEGKTTQVTFTAWPEYVSFTNKGETADKIGSHLWNRKGMLQDKEFNFEGFGVSMTYGM